MSFLEKFAPYNLNLHGVRLPTFETPEGESSNEEFLRSLSLEGFKKLGIKKGSEEYKKYSDRAKHELGILKELGFIDYILLVWKVVDFCNSNNIPTGPGRGSAAGSLILFLIGVTKIDSVKHDLYFERFVSKIRAKKKIVKGITYLDGSLMCDVDLDICYYNRGRVIEFLQKEFIGKTSKILTLSKLSGKILIKDCGKVISGKTETEMNGVTALIPKVFGIVKDIEEAYLSEDSFREWCDENKSVYDISLKLKGLIRNKGVHASGMLLSRDELKENCPIELTSDKDFVSGYDMNWASLLNVKLDLLGLRSVTVVDDVCKQIGISSSDIDVEDPSIYRNLQELKCPHGLFQLEAGTNFKVCRKVKPRNIDELSAVLALARPGALAFLDQYAKYIETGEAEPIHPFFDDILSSTGGVALYQEQLMKMAHKIGFTLDEAEVLRRIVGKKKVSEVRKWKKKIREKIKENKLDPDIGDVLWRVLEDSANYSFNKSHSIAYANLSATTIYLKFNHPKEFFLSLLKMTRFEPDPISEISKIHRELRKFGVELLPPHLIKSDMSFSVEKDNIRFGLLSIKGISDKSIEKVNSFRNKYSNKFEIFQAAQDAGIPMGILSSLIQAGALEGFKQSRSQVVLESQLWKILTDRERRFIIPLGEKFDYDLPKIARHLCSFKDEKGKVIIKPSRRETIRRKYSPYVRIYQQNNKSKRFANWYYEKSCLGYAYDVSLRDIFLEKKPNLITLDAVDETPANSIVSFVGEVKDVYKSKSKKGTKYVKFFISDESNSVDALLFENSFDKVKNVNRGSIPEKGNIVIVNGRKKGDAVFIDLMGAQDHKVYTKLSELPNEINEETIRQIDSILDQLGAN
jgi:DNA polymerase-3 subunit alpha